jgi:hypothetical protein
MTGLMQGYRADDDDELFHQYFIPFFFFREAFPLYLAITSVRHVLYTGSRRNDIQIFNKKFRKGLGGVVVSVVATGPKGFGFKTRPRRWIFKDDKNPQHTFLSDGKVLCRKILRHVK